MLCVMKAVIKKRMVSRKKPSKKSKSQSLSSKKAANKSKTKKPVIDSKTVEKQPQSNHTSPVTKKRRNGKGRPWVKGQSGNPKGRPKDGHTRLDNLLKGLRAVESERNLNLLKHFFEEAFTDKTILVAAMKKLYPDLKSIEQVTLAADSMTEKEAADIRREMAKRFNRK